MIPKGREININYLWLRRALGAFIFGGASVLAVMTALIAPWFRMSALVEGGQLEVSRSMASMWEKLDAKYQSDPALLSDPPKLGEPVQYAGGDARGGFRWRMGKRSPRLMIL